MKRKMWVVYSTQRTYLVEGSEQFAEDVRRRKARHHGCVFRKRVGTETDATGDLEARETP